MIAILQNRLVSCSHLRNVLANFDLLQASMAAVDVIPLFLETAPDLLIDDEDLLISSPSSCGAVWGKTGFTVCIQHIPTGLRVESSGKRTFQNPLFKILSSLN